MQRTIEFGKWYKSMDNKLAYSFLDDRNRTTALIRGKLVPLLKFIDALSRVYSGKPLYKIYQFRLQLKAVLESGKPDISNQLPCFSDDRIRFIRRLDDDKWLPKDGPFAGSDTDVEIGFDEQYGGEYPTAGRSSRAMMINRVLEALDALESDVMGEEQAASKDEVKAGPISRLLKWLFG